MIFENQGELKERVEHLSGRRVYGRLRVEENTSRCMSIVGGCVLRLQGDDYFVLGDTKEGRFGIDEQPKFWVKYALDLSTGERKILKLVFHEHFTARVANITFRMTRSPDKESAFLELVRGDRNFMQGRTVRDPWGQNVRVIDFIRGASLYNYLADMDMPHEQYFYEVLPHVMQRIIGCIDAVAWVHRQGLHHGDIRNDHILIEMETDAYVWIDFDYEVNLSDYDIWSMGNVINYVVGKGIHTFHGVRQNPEQYPDLSEPPDALDGLYLQKNRIANLRKLFPYIPKAVNDILLRFSLRSELFYCDLAAQSRDLRAIFGD